MLLSLCIVTYNEENFIHYPLDAAYDLVDEVIIVDGRSTDNTVGKAKSYGEKVKVFIEDNPPMFHINKQKAIERAKGEWILQLDADEALSPQLKEEIDQLFHGSAVTSPNSLHFKGGDKQGGYSVEQSNNRTMEDSPVAYWVSRKNFFLTTFLNKGGVYPDYTIRLYKKGVARFPCKSVHENVEIKGGMDYLRNPILHYADPDFSRYLIRWNRYTTLDARMLVEQKESVSFFEYFFQKPVVWFFNAYVRHAGFRDGFPGFIFALFSALRFWVIYVKVWGDGKEKDFTP